jgi:long-chain acyl-CoA synthetase
MLWEFISKRMTMFDKSWISDTERRYTYSEMLDNARLCGKKLKQKLAVKATCCILCTNNYNTAVALLGCWYADLVPIPISINYGERHCEIIINTTKPTIIITDDSSITCKYNSFSFNISSYEFDGKINQEDECELLEDIALIMNTSGTTGSPKGAMITEEGLIQNILGIDEYFNIQCEDTILIARPLYHCAVLTGEFLISLYKGLNIVFLSGLYNPISVLKCMENEKVSVLCGTPTLFQHLVTFCKRMKKQHFVKVIVLSGECLTKEIAKQIREVFIDADIYNVYGLTEASPRVSYLKPALFDSIPESVGVGLKNTTIKIIDDLGSELSPNEHGNVCVLSPCIMKGYYRNNELTKAKIKKNWLLTGDIGYIDENGYLYILSRADDMIIKAGMNIYPKEIENALDKLPMVKENVAYGVLENGVQVIAIDVVLEEGFECSKKELMATFSHILPSYQLPNFINVVDCLTRNASGKIVRNAKMF